MGAAFEGAWALLKDSPYMQRIAHSTSATHPSYSLMDEEHTMGGVNTSVPKANPNSLLLGTASLRQPHQRQGHYDKMLRTLLQHLPDDGTLQSWARNKASQPFHEKFMANLPPTIEGNVEPQETPYYAKVKDSRDKYTYNRKPTPKDWGDLRYDLGGYPLVQADEGRRTGADTNTQSTLEDF